MKTRPIHPAQIDFSGGVPASPLYGDVYHPPIGALEQAAHVFLRGNGLPGRWAGRRHFTILETGFGLGNNFLATWQAWREDPQRCERLFFVSTELHPPTRDDLQRAHAASPLPALAAQLLQAWPPLTANLHPLDFENGRVQLLLALGDVATLLPGLRLQADAFYLDGFAPARNPAMWQARVLKALGRKAAPGATLATWSVARQLRDGLVTAGFELQRVPGIGGKREITLGRFAPRFQPPALPDAAVPAAQQAVVVGAGIAGAAATRALVRLGLQVRVFESAPQVAAGASGNAAGLFHGTVHADDGVHARLFRATALVAARSYDAPSGLLRIHTDAAWMQALLNAQALPADYVQALPAEQAAALAGVALSSPAWFYPGGGVLAPTSWVQLQLAQPGVQLALSTPVQRLQREGQDWLLLDTAGALLARTPLLVLANAAEAQRLLAPLGHAPWPLQHSRGQVTQCSVPHPLKRAVAGDGYALPLPGGGLLCGATREPGEPGGDTAPSEADHRYNLERLQRLTGLPAPGAWQGRVGWRLHSDDRLPIAGALPLVAMPASLRRDQARLLPREPGLFVLTALGARGLTLAPLLGRLLAAQATGTPWPLEQDLVDAIDPARWLVRAARSGPAQEPFQG